MANADGKACFTLSYESIYVKTKTLHLIVKFMFYKVFWMSSLESIHLTISDKQITDEQRNIQLHIL